MGATSHSAPGDKTPGTPRSLFILARMREARAQSGDDAAAVVTGLRRVHDRFGLHEEAPVPERVTADA